MQFHVVPNHIKEAPSVDNLVVEVERVGDRVLINHSDRVVVVHLRELVGNDFLLIEGIALFVIQ